MITLERYLGLGYLVTAEDGRDLLVQGDYDFPSLAGHLGWSPAHVQHHAHHDAACEDYEGCDCEPCGRGADCPQACPHYLTDGTVDCPVCGASAAAFIESAVSWLDAHDGDSFEDPGYFEEEANG